MYKCLNSDQFYTYNDQSLLQFRGEACSNDPHFYQTCDKRTGGQITNNQVLCEHYLCDERGISILTSAELKGRGKCSYHCENTDLNKEGCDDDSDTTVTLPTGVKARPSEICNDICDVYRCEDEALCNEFQYGIYCINWEGFSYVSPGAICDGYAECNGREDEDCTVTTNTAASCTHHDTKKIVPVYNYTRCSSKTYCRKQEIASDQTNCSDPTRVALTCDINGYQSTVSKYILCSSDGITVCDDGIDSNCFRTKICTIHKHLLCDENVDCSDMSDENHEICSSKTIETCKRRVGGKKELPIPISWLRDGVWDCMDGIDETADWLKCGQGKTSRLKSRSEEKCENVFVCRTGKPGYELLRNLCDGLENCGNENKVCSVSGHSKTLTTTVVTSDKGLSKRLAFCFKGLNSLQLLISPCLSEKFIYPHGDVFGVDTKTSVMIPNDKQSCDHIYGEQYLYTSCTGRCIESSCPLRNTPRYEYCPNQFSNRVGTIVNNEYLIFLTKSFGTLYTNRYFICENKISCIDFSKVCDLVADCEDGSDENQCTNHFKCNSSGKLLPKTKKCDGFIDCADLSDECNDFCSKEILDGYLMKGISWLIGFLAVVANLIIIGKSLKALRKCKTTAALINRWLIISIALGDFLIGCYLFIISTYDAIIFRKGYCERQINWITSLECSIIGVFSTIGSQISLFSMTGLSLVRMHGIRNSMSIPGEVNLIKSLKIAAAMLFLVMISATIAVVPILGNFQDFFVNGVRFSEGLKIFIGTPNKETLQEVIQAYYGRTRDGTLSWETLTNMVKDMFSHDFDYEDLTKTVEKVEFYGNDGVCLFKYFVHNNDPQRNFVWSILSLNFVCFLFISISYFIIGILSRRSSKSLASSQNKRQIDKRNNRMNRRIAFIITTDFLCWVPFIVICVLHSLEVLDATPWYSLFSMVILPINSVINPLLYDDAVTNAIRVPLGYLSRRISTLSNSTILQRVWSNSVQSQAEENPVDNAQVGNEDVAIDSTGV